MARRCTITGKDSQFGNNVSHSKRKTKKQFVPNIQNISFFSDALKKKIPLKVTVSTVRTVDVNGGLDSYLLSTSNRKLTDAAVKIKNKIKKVLNKV